MMAKQPPTPKQPGESTEDFHQRVDVRPRNCQRCGRAWFDIVVAWASRVGVYEHGTAEAEFQQGMRSIMQNEPTSKMMQVNTWVGRFNKARRLLVHDCDGDVDGKTRPEVPPPSAASDDLEPAHEEKMVRGFGRRNMQSDARDRRKRLVKANQDERQGPESLYATIPAMSPYADSPPFDAGSLPRLGGSVLRSRSAPASTRTSVEEAWRSDLLFSEDPPFLHEGHAQSYGHVPALDASEAGFGEQEPEHGSPRLNRNGVPVLFGNIDSEEMRRRVRRRADRQRQETLDIQRRALLQRSVSPRATQMRDRQRDAQLDPIEIPHEQDPSHGSVFARPPVQQTLMCQAGPPTLTSIRVQGISNTWPGRETQAGPIPSTSTQNKQGVPLSWGEGKTHLSPQNVILSPEDVLQRCPSNPPHRLVLAPNERLPGGVLDLQPGTELAVEQGMQSFVGRQIVPPDISALAIQLRAINQNFHTASRRRMQRLSKAFPDFNNRNGFLKNINPRSPLWDFFMDYRLLTHAEWMELITDRDGKEHYPLMSWMAGRKVP